MKALVEAVKKKWRYMVVVLEIKADTSFLPFEIKLPNKIKKVTGVLITNNAPTVGQPNNMLGTLSLQSNDTSDVFLSQPVFIDCVAPTDESYFGMANLPLSSNLPWITGLVPKKLPLNVSAETGTINGWFKTEYTPAPYTLKVAVEYEGFEEIIHVDQKHL